MELVVRGGRLQRFSLFGLSVTRRDKSLQPIHYGAGGGGWFRLWTIQEPSTGAWQTNEPISLGTALQNSTLFRCVDVLSGDIGKMRVLLMDRSTGIDVEVRQSPFLQVLRRPNDTQTHVEFYEWWMMSKLLHGNTYVLKRRDLRGMVNALYVLNPERVKPLIAPDGALFYELQPDNLELLNVDGPIRVPAREIIHDKHKPLYDKYCGIPPWYSCMQSLNQATSIQTNSAKFQANGAQPGGVITTPAGITQAQADAVKSTWETGFTGDNAGKVAVLSDGMTYTPMAVMSSKDSQLVEQLNTASEDICRAYGVPRYKAGVGPDPTYNNIQALNQQYYTDTLQLHIEKLESLLDQGLELPDHYHTKFDIDALLRMDTKTLMETIQVGVRSGVMAPNEGRAKLNLPPVDGGDSPYLQHQDYSLEALARRDEAAPAPASAGSANGAPSAPPAEEPAKWLAGLLGFKAAPAYSPDEIEDAGDDYATSLRDEAAA